MTPGPSVGDLEPTEAESRRAARERALELLYEAGAKGVTVDDVLAGLPVAPDALARELAQGVAAHGERIDPVLARLVAPKWSLNRLAAVDRAILRIGAYELFEVPSRSQALVINEAVLLARRFGTDDSPRFVNGVLSAVAAEARPADGAPAAASRPSGRASKEAEPAPDPSAAAADPTSDDRAARGPEAGPDVP